MLDEQGAVMRLKGPTENLFLDALSLDPLCGLEVPLPSRLESEKKFPCMEEVTPAPESKLLISPLFWDLFSSSSSQHTIKGMDGTPIDCLQ